MIFVAALLGSLYVFHFSICMRKVHTLIIDYQWTRESPQKLSSCVRYSLGVYVLASAFVRVFV